MKQLNQIAFSSKDKKYYLSPYLEEEIKKEELQLRIKYNSWILVGSLSSLASLMTGYAFCGLGYPLKEGQVYTYQIFTSFNLIVFSIIGGLFVDFLSIKQSWQFLIFSSICSQLLIQIAVKTDIQQISILSQNIICCIFPIFYINFICVLYETADKLSIRLNNAIKLEIYGFQLPIIIGNLLNIISQTFYRKKEITIPQLIQLNKVFVFVGVCICLIINGISIIILQKTYKQIQRIRAKSEVYSKYQTFQGMGLSFFKILKYFKNKDILYLCSISSITGFHYGSMGLILTINTYLYNILRICGMVAGIFIGYLITRRINSSCTIVTTSYKAVRKCIYSLVTIRVIQIVCLHLIDSDEAYSDDLLHCISYTVLMILQVIVYVLLCALIHQMIIFLLSSRCAIRGTCLSLTLVFYFIFYLIVYLIREYKNLQYIFSISHITAIIVFDYYYQKQKKFSNLDGKLLKQN